MQNIVEYTGLELRRGVVPEAKLALGENKDQEEKMVKDRTLGNHNSIRVTGDIETRGTGCVGIISFVKDNVGGFRQVSCVVQFFVVQLDIILVPQRPLMIRAVQSYSDPPFAVTLLSISLTSKMSIIGDKLYYFCVRPLIGIGGQA